LYGERFGTKNETVCPRSHPIGGLTPSERGVRRFGRQLLRSATSIGANYREANRAVSRPDFANKIGTIQKEAAETQYWLELLIESGSLKHSNAADLHKESTELLAIFTTIGRKLKE
jgi:four helix bundle protein